MSMLNANNTPYVRRIKDLLDDLFRMDKIHVFKKYAKMLTSRKMFQKRKKHGQNKTTLWAIHWSENKAYQWTQVQDKYENTGLTTNNRSMVMRILVSKWSYSTYRFLTV